MQLRRAAMAAVEYRRKFTSIHALPCRRYPPSQSGPSLPPRRVRDARTPNILNSERTIRTKPRRYWVTTARCRPGADV
eukprot:6187268-Pleurochrysis_carterae.AAC.3